MSRARSQPTRAIAVAAAGLLVLTTGAVVAAKDWHKKDRCSMRGSAAFGQGHHSAVDRPDRFVGLSETAARELAKEDGYTSRIVCQDGRNLIVTMDLRADRIGFGVHHGRVVGYWLS